MSSWRRLLREFRQILAPSLPRKHGVEGIVELGHREYVGGMWDAIGKLQFDFMLSRGLKPSHFFLDVGCGSLRGGIHFIRYLDPGHYLGVDKEPLLMQKGMEDELGLADHEERMPELLVLDRFQFHRLSQLPSFALAQSLFTHLTPDAIGLCMRSLRLHVRDGCRFFVTFFESEQIRDNPEESHDQEVFFYTLEQMDLFGREHDWNPIYIGEWGHPRGQSMIEYRAS